MWLCGLRTISHATLANFRKDHQAELDDLFTQSPALLETAGAIKPERVMHDGAEIRPQAGAQKPDFGAGSELDVVRLAPESIPLHLRSGVYAVRPRLSATIELLLFAVLTSERPSTDTRREA
jgi:hypothetical protein